MPYIPPSVVQKVKRMDLLTYLENYEPYELVHFSGNTYTTRTHDSLKVRAGSGTEVIPRWQEILFSLTGETMERLTECQRWNRQYYRRQQKKCDSLMVNLEYTIPENRLDFQILQV